MTTMAFEEIDFLPDYASRAAALADPDVGYYLQASSNGTDWSNADAVITSVTSQLFDGAQVAISSYQPMTATVRVKIVGRDPGRLAAAGAVLTNVCRRKGVRSLTFTPADAPTTVFDVLVAEQKLELNDFDEVNGIPYPKRVYVLTLTCKPFPRSADSVVVTAVTPQTGAITSTSIDAGSSTSGWSTTVQRISRINMIGNPSFEAGTNGWAPAGAATISRAATVPGGRVGSYGLAVSPPVSQRSRVVSSPMLVTAGLPYAFQARIVGGVGAAATGGLTVQWYDSSGTQIGVDSTYTFSATVDDSSYTTVGTVYTAPAGAVTVRLVVWDNQPDAVHGYKVWFVDGVLVEQASSVGSYFDGNSGPGYAWTAAANLSPSVALAPATVSTSGGKVQAAAYLSPALTRIGTINTATQKYLMISGTLTFPDAVSARNVTFQLDADGVILSPAFLTYSQGSATGGAFTAYFRINADSVSTFTLRAAVTSGAALSGNTTLAVDQVSTYSGLPIIGTGRQSQRTIAAYGTMPAEAELTISNGGTNPLGASTILFTKPSDGSTFTPPLRQYRSGGPTVTTSSSSISGATNPLATSQASADTFQIDVNKINPSSYLLAMWAAGTGLTAGTTYTLSWRASIVENGTTEHSVVTGSTTITPTGTTTPAGVIELGLMTLPPRDMSTTGSSTAVVQIQVWVSAGTWTLDEAWLFDVDNGALSILGTSQTAHQLQVVPATADSPQQQYLSVTTSGSGTIVRNEAQSVIAWQAHRFDPVGGGTVDVFLMNNAATPALSVAAEYFPRWDMYASDLPSTSAA